MNMRRIVKAMIAVSLLTWAAPVLAQDEEIIVTGTRIRSDDSGASPRPAPSMMLRRTADFAVQVVHVVGDTRDELKRRE
jgi:hypothetical protein